MKHLTADTLADLGLDFSLVAVHCCAWSACLPMLLYPPFHCALLLIWVHDYRWIFQLDCAEGVFWVF